MAMRGVSVVLATVLVVACMMVHTTEAAKIETFNAASCAGAASNTFYINGGCQRFNDQGAVRVSEISAGTRVSIHNQLDCEQYSSVGQFYGPGCSIQGATKIRAVFIEG